MVGPRRDCYDVGQARYLDRSAARGPIADAQLTRGVESPRPHRAVLEDDDMVAAAGDLIHAVE